jgi:DNA primase
MIDVIKLLEDHEIDYKQSGPNVTRGWVEINCPFLCSDPSYHLGINIETGNFNCWVCGEKGKLSKLISELLKISWQKTNQLINQYEIFDDYQEEEQKKITDSDLLKPFDIELPKPHREYLIKRNFDPDFLIKKYSLRSCWKQGDFAYRIIIPIIEEEKVINFTGRSISKLLSPKYKHCQNEKAIYPMKECIYNIDNLKRYIIIVEGPTDVWRIGDGAVATMGTEFTQTQIKLITNKKIPAFILFDSEAQKNAEKLANQLSPFISVEILTLDKGDPADMTEDEVNNLRREIGI